MRYRRCWNRCRRRHTVAPMNDGADEAGEAISSSAVVPTLYRDGIAYMQALGLEALIASLADGFERHGSDCCAAAVRTVAAGVGAHALRIDTD
jgi:hypothetical protein